MSCMVVLNKSCDVVQQQWWQCVWKSWVFPLLPETIASNFVPFALSRSHCLSLLVQGVLETCQLLSTSLTFSRCHHRVDPEPYISLCERDICACPQGVDCHCPAFLEYARSCAHQGVILEGWPEESSCSKLAHLFLGCSSPVRSCLSCRFMSCS